MNITYPYEQTTIERQIDQTYHNAYPIVPVGTIIDFAGLVVPVHYLLCNGTALEEQHIIYYFCYWHYWGGGDGSTTFNVPNLVDYVTAGTEEYY